MTDNLTPAQRSYCMARNKGTNTGIERLVRSDLHRRGLRFRKHVKGLPGKPDVVFRGARLAVFLDGDFWHGYRFPAWQDIVSGFWQDKIEATRQRDQRNFRSLRRQGWRVLRIWEHEIETDLERAVNRIAEAVERSAAEAAPRTEVRSVR